MGDYRNRPNRAERRPRAEGLSPSEAERYDRIVAEMYAEQGRMPNGNYPEVCAATHRTPWLVANEGLDTVR